MVTSLLINGFLTSQLFKKKKNKLDEGPDEPTVTYIDLKNPKKPVEGAILDEMGVHKYCCRRMMISNTHLISSIS